MRGCDETHPVIVEFWEIVEGYDPDQLSRLLQFATGSPRLPPVCVAQDDETAWLSIRVRDQVLPTSHTCAKVLTLPATPDVSLAAALDLALEFYRGFGVA